MTAGTIMYPRAASSAVRGFTRSVTTSGGKRLLLMRLLDALRRRAKAAQERVHRERHRAEHGDLADGVEGAEVDEHDVDDVGAASLRQRAAQEERRDAVRRGPGQHRVGERREPAAGADREQQIARAPRPVAQS